MGFNWHQSFSGRAESVDVNEIKSNANYLGNRLGISLVWNEGTAVGDRIDKSDVQEYQDNIDRLHDNQNCFDYCPTDNSSQDTGKHVTVDNTENATDDNGLHSSAQDTQHTIDNNALNSNNLNTNYSSDESTKFNDDHNTNYIGNDNSQDSYEHSGYNSDVTYCSSAESTYNDGKKSDIKNGADVGFYTTDNDDAWGTNDSGRESTTNSTRESSHCIGKNTIVYDGAG